MTLLGDKDTFRRSDAATASETVVQSNLRFLQLLLLTILSNKHIFNISIKGDIKNILCILLSNETRQNSTILAQNKSHIICTHLMDLKITAIIFYLDFSHRSALFLFHLYRLHTFLINWVN